MGLRIAGLENKFMNSWIMRKLTSSNSSTTVAKIAMWSNLTKDAVNCYYYVTQSLKNEKIPDDKRNFVAGLDLSNGILNVITQYLLGNATIKWTDKLFDKKIAPKFYGKEAIEAAAKNIKNNSTEAVADAFRLNKNIAKAGMKVIATLAATQVVCKRIIVPLIATPMATYFKNHFDKKQGKISSNPGNLKQDTVQISKKDEEKIAQNPQQTKTENFPKCFQSFMK